ncbi:unnamed protein product, partial [Vitis vinifera]
MGCTIGYMALDCIEALVHLIHLLLPKRLLATNYSPFLNSCICESHPLLQSSSTIFSSCSLRGKMHLFSPYVLVFALVCCWMAYFTPMVFSINLVDEFALIALKAHITKDSQGILATNWSTKSSHCSWYGIFCNAPQQRVSTINLSNMGLEGTIAPQVGNLSFLVSLDLSNNYFHASLPKDIGKILITFCKDLQQLNLFNNKLVENIPEAICNLSKLEELYLGNNQLTGEIPKAVSHLHNLKILSLQMNNLIGSIPATIFNISSLLNISLSYNSLSGIIYLSFNEFTGSIPRAIGNLVELERLSLRNNSLTGEIPQSLFNISRLKFLSLAANNLKGEIPSSLLHCRELRLLDLSINQFTGFIPQAIGSLSNLETLYLGFNQLAGGIPGEIGNLSNLNLLNSASSGLSGPIPAEIFNISSLQEIGFANNSLSGSLPMDICKHLPNLQWLLLSLNQLSGQLPTTLEIGNLSKLEQIYFRRSSFTGTIPPSFGNLTALQHLDLGENNIQASELAFLTSLTNCIFLRTLSISDNPLKGMIPNSLGNLSISLEIIYASDCQLRGTIPTGISNLTNLIGLRLDDNDLTGLIPTPFGRLQKLQMLSISQNRIHGSIPSGLCHLTNLAFLDLSSNKLSGTIPSCSGNLTGLRLLVLNLSSNFLNSQLPLQVGNMKSLLQGHIPPNFALCGAPRQTKSETPIQVDLSLPRMHRMIPHQELLYATNYFGEDNLIGKGSLGMVYKGVLSDGLIVAVKVFNLELQGAFKSFEVECEVMRNIRHRNLAKIISSCSNLDFKALVLEYMPNGSLEKWLYSHNYYLDFVQRLKIMIDRTKTLGTVGYMAPEYGSEGIVSTKGDIYSYGILLMETFVRKKPTDEMFVEELTLKSWVESSTNNIMEVIDANLLTEEDESFALKRACFSSIMTLALDCTVEPPEKRINTKDSCFFDDYPMIQSGQAENVNLHVYRFGSYFFRKYKYSCIYESPTSSNFTPINSIFHSHNLCHAPILYYSSPIITYSALLIPLQYLLISLSRTNSFVFLEKTAPQLSLLDRLNPLVQKMLRVSCPFRDHHTGILVTNWSTKSSYCTWYGISCNAPQQRVSAINLSNMGLEGTIAPQVGNLSFLISLDLSNNYFHAFLPKEIGKCKELQQLNLFNNNLVGSIPEAICNLSKLEELYLGNNKLAGEIPKKMTTIFNISSLLNISLSYNSLSGNLPMVMCNTNPKLKELNLSSNHLSGEIPTSLSQCIKLQVISLSYNEFTGSIPKGIGNLVELQRLSFRNNNLIGEIPQSLFNISSLRFLNLAANQLEGEIPSNLSHCRELRVLSLSLNQFTGGIPQAIGSLSNLEELYLGYNNLGGGIPSEIGNLHNLNILNFDNNSLSGRSIIREIGNLSKLEQIYLGRNNFTSTIPPSFGNLTAIQELGLEENNFQGNIPKELGKLINLQILHLGQNNLTGIVPEAIINISKLQVLSLSLNHLSGSLPSSIGTWLPNLEGLYIGANEFSGKIPMSISNMSKLLFMDISNNYFIGNLPKDLDSELAFFTSLTNCISLRKLRIGGNPLKGIIPNSLGNLSISIERIGARSCQLRGTIPTGKLQAINLHSNGLASEIPSSLWILRYLLFLNLSSNFLNGELPLEVGNMKSLEELDLSKNQFSGNIPSTISLLQNLLQLYLSHNKLQGHIPPNFDDLALKYLKYLNVSFNKLQGEIPNGGPFANFTAESFISNLALCGAPRLGTVYKGVLSDGLIVAVKVFNLELQGAFKSFEVECEVMQNIRHRNLAKIISSCSNLDFKALVLEYMPNGSLEKWLYSHNYYLDFVQRLKIMIDVASGLEYLHHDYSSPVVHCDLKPNNVLLDDDMVAHISDFGIAKLLMGSEFMKRTKTLGTIGYMAPEYGSEGIVSTKCDIYSFGIMLMETFVRKKPTDEMFMEELTLKTEPPEKRINMKDTLRSLTALTGLTGVTAAVCCYTSEVVALLKLGGLLHFVRLVTQWKILRHRSGYRICKILVRWIKSFQSRLNAFAPLSWTAPSYCLFLNTLCLINFSGFFLGFGRTALSLDPRLALLSFWKTAPQLSLLDRLNPLLQERLRVSLMCRKYQTLCSKSLFYFLTHFFQEVCYPPITLPSLTLVLLNHILSFNIYQRLFFLVLVRLIFGNNQRYYQPLLQKCQYALIFNISSLLNISLSYKSLSGSLPMNICNTNPKLKELNLSSNHLSGQIPIGLGQCIKLQVISLSYNEFTGSIPRGIGELEKYLILWPYLDGNQLSGQLPATLSLCGELLSLSLFYNKFAGSIPREIGNLSKLEYINLRRNSFAGSIPPSFGNIPKELGNLINLQFLDLCDNNLMGIVPEAIFNISKLQILSLVLNHLSGSLPSGIGTWLPDLEGLYIGANQFSGIIPLSISNWLHLSGNQLTDEHSTSELAFLTSLTNCNSLRKFIYAGFIPTSSGLLQKLQFLAIPGNRIHGSIPRGLCHLTNLGYLDLSSNKLPGTIPSYFGNLTRLRNIYSTNYPWNTISLLQNLLQLFLSHNKLQGHMPPNLEALKYLKYLNVSFNKVQGEIPNGGPFANFTAESFISNLALYNLIGKGSLGMVYKGVLSDGLIVAVKVFNLELQGAFKSFEVECEVMRNIRHRNLAKIISSCSNLDFKALVLEYMPNGSLEKWLYSHKYYLDFVQRLKIMIDVASGLEYLHHDYSNPVVHCDLKPSNVLLDDDMVAHISDFGIAKLLIGNEFMKRTKTLGTIGYMAPEYGSEGIASTKGDIYSYGIMLMETFVGKKPTDEMFMEELTLKTCFSSIMTLALDCAAEPPEKRINMKDVVVRLKKLLNQIDCTVVAPACPPRTFFQGGGFRPISFFLNTPLYRDMRADPYAN